MKALTARGGSHRTTLGDRLDSSRNSGGQCVLAGARLKVTDLLLCTHTHTIHALTLDRGSGLNADTLDSPGKCGGGPPGPMGPGKRSPPGPGGPGNLPLPLPMGNPPRGPMPGGPALPSPDI